jgi:hypothetical protein
MPAPPHQLQLPAAEPEAAARRARPGRLGLGLTAAAVVLAGCSGASSGGGAPPTTVATTSAAPSPTASAARVRLGGVATVLLPAGWSHTETTSTTANIDTPFHTACLDDPSVTAADGGCDVVISWGDTVSGNEGKPWVVHQVAGWSHSTDVSPCPVPGSTTDSTAADFGVASMDAPPEQGFAKIGSKTAYLDTYSATCGDGQTFSPRIWWLPVTHLMVEDVLGNPATAGILAGFRFTGTSGGASPTTAPVSPGPVHGYLTALGGGKLTIQIVRTYGNDAAGKAYAAAHGIAYPFENDYVDIPTGKATTVPTSSSTTCKGGVRVAGTEPLKPKTVPCSRFGTYLAGTGPVLVDATVGQGGFVTSLVEVYRP